MKALITGGAGFIGSHIVDKLIEEGHEVVIVDNLSTGLETNINPKAKFYRIDIRSSELEEVFKTERPDVVNHHAAQMSVRVSTEKPLYDSEINILGSLKILEYSKLYGVKKIIYASSGGTVYGEPQNLPCRETDLLLPICQYGVSKLAVEYYLHVYKVNYGLPYTVFRYPNIYGPRQNPLGEAGVIAIFAQQMLCDEQTKIRGDGLQERDFLYISDCVKANILAMQGRGNGQIYNLGTGKGTNIRQIFNMLKEITQYKKMAKDVSPKQGETRKIYLDFTKVSDDMGWEPIVPMREGLKQVVNHIKSELDK